VASRVMMLACRANRKLWSIAHILRWCQDRPLILMYHRIAVSEVDPWRLAVPPMLFEQHLEFICEHRLVLPLMEFSRLHRADRLPADAVAITFDDGYACNAHTAAPLLTRYGLPATIFLITSAISADEDFWWDALEHIVLETDAKRLDLSLCGRTTSVVLGNHDEPDVKSNWSATAEPRTARQAAYLELWSRLRVASDQERRRALAALHRQAGIAAQARPSHRAMTVQEVRQISSSGLIQVGCHTVNHPLLSTLTRAEQKLEIERSRDTCYDLIGRHPLAFAYPYGDFNYDTVGIVGGAGFTVACTTREFGVSAHSQMLRMPRLAAGAWNPSEINAAIARIRPEAEEDFG
jgi:peptidoglycan/xylan/chitin deacetylase (PgdA/CDA1 family)